MRRSIIIAAAVNGVIGRDGKIPWRLSSDLKRFKALTMGHHLIMGRKTFESIGKALPGRVTIVLTRDASRTFPEGVLVARSLDEAMVMAANAGDPEPFVCGGAAVYEQAMRICDRLYLTRIEQEVEGDVAVNFNFNKWERVEEEHFPTDEPPYVYEIWERKRDAAGKA